MRLLLAGASGFLGRHVLLHAPAGWDITAVYRSAAGFPEWVAQRAPGRVTAIRCDLTDAAAVAAALHNSAPFDAALFVAGGSNISESVRAPRADLDASACALLNLIEHTRTRRFVFLSSGTVYLGADGPVSPDSATTPLVPYGISKLASELYVRHFQANTDRIDEYVVLRFFGAYGPMEPSWKLFGRLIRHFAIEGRKEFVLRGDGQNLIDAMYVSDAAQGLWRAVTASARNQTVDFCAGTPRTLQQLVLEIGDILGAGPVHVTCDGQTSEYIGFHASPHRFAALFDFQPRITLADGLGRFRQWMLQESV